MMVGTGPQRDREEASPDVSVTASPEGGLESLLALSARGQIAAFERIYDQTAGAVLGIATRVLRNRAIAEEVAQDVLVEIWLQSSRYDPHRGSAKAWIMTLAHARAVDRVRSEQSASDRERRAAARVTARPYDDVAEQAEANLEGDLLRRCLQGLTESQHESVRLAYYDGYTYPEVAALLHKPLGTVKTRIRDGVAKLRDCMTRGLP